MTTLLESKARPYGSGKGAVLSVAVHGALIAAAVVASGSVALPAREKVEEHPVLYVATPPPKVHVAPEPLPEVKKAPPPKAPPRAEPPRLRAPAPRPVAARPQPAQPQMPTLPTPGIVAPIKVPTSLPPVDLKGLPTVAEVVGPPPVPRASSSAGRATSDGDVDATRGGNRGGLGSGDPNRAYNENQVDRAVQVTRSAVPRYPEALKSVNVEGEVMVRYIVDARGRVEPGSIQVISTAHRLFSDAVRAALLEMRFRPAEAGGRPVRQLVQQPFKFRLQ